jgi:hypothetical protein
MMTSTETYPLIGKEESYVADDGEIADSGLRN